jgi:hypothetical protein
MPILTYESHRQRKSLTKAIIAAGDQQNHNWRTQTELLIKGYLSLAERPLHCRRTLDQYLYYMLPSTEARDIDQVVYRWAKREYKDEEPAESRPIIMVDQLWLWVLHDGC